MSRLQWLILALLLILPNEASALSLAWSSGGSTLTFSHTTACTLLVEADEGEPGLAGEWRLLWVARGCSRLEVVVDSLASDPDVGEPILANAASIAEQAGHTRTLHFSSPDGAATRTARLRFTLPAGSAGKFEVVELCPEGCVSSPGGVLRSGVVTFNGGVANPFPPTILKAASTHETAQFSVSILGSGLDTPSALALGGPDRSWSQPLAIVESNDTTLTAMAELPVALPDAFLSLESEDGTSTVQLLLGDSLFSAPVVKGNSWLVVPENPDYVIPKDFAFVYNSVPTGVDHNWRSLFHIIYIRHFVHPVPGYDENSFGHLWSDGRDGLEKWHLDTLSFKSGAVGFDKLHVWAPTIVQNGNRYHMFYTGVDSVNDQRIMRVSAALLDTSDTRDTAWTNAGRTVVHTVFDKGWGKKNRTAPPDIGREIRDPYVFPDPDNAGRFLMLYTSRDSVLGSIPLAIGLARNSPGTLNTWTDLGRYYASTKPKASIGRLESPHAFPDSTNGTLGWRLMYTEADGRRTNSVQMLTAGSTSSVSDTAAAAWPTSPDSLYGYLFPDTTAAGWVASEQLRAGKIDFLAAQNGYDFDGIHIARMYWSGSNFHLQVPSIVSVDDQGSRVNTVRLALRNFAPTRRPIQFAVETPARMLVKLALYDVMGRRVAVLLDKTVEPGQTLVRWNGTGPAGSLVQSGMYFACLSFAGGTRTASFPMVK